MDIVLDDSNIDKSLKDPKKLKTIRIDKARKEFIVDLFRLLEM